MEEVLRDLRSEGYLLSVATMKIEDVATEFIRGLGLEDLFLTVAGADASGTVTKADMNALNADGAQPTLTFTAYAVQLNKNNTTEFTAAEAWALAETLPTT